MYPLLQDKSLQKQVEDIYQQYVEPYERGWELLQQASQKRELPTTFELYSHPEKEKRMKEGEGIVCCKCNVNVQESEGKRVCVLCKDAFCDQCLKGASSKPNERWICPTCQQLTTPSWGDLLFCIECGLPIEESEVETKCWRCCQCSGLFHRHCIKTTVDDPQSWTCCDCCNLPEDLDSLTSTILIDPTSNFLTCYYSS